MKIFSWNDIINPKNSQEQKQYFAQGSGISVGSFDGLHHGHRILLNSLINGCEKRNLLKGIVTFVRPLPSIKHSSDYAGDVSTLKQRLSYFENIGIDFVIVVDFKDSFAALSGTDFFTKLIDNCALKFIAEGVDFRCGYKGATDAQAIKYFAEQKNLETIFVDPVYYKPGTDEEERISSSYIRTMIKKGFLTTVEELLERKYELDLSEKKSEKEVNTSDILQVIPPDGVYHCKNEKNEDVRVIIDSVKISMTFPCEVIIF